MVTDTNPNANGFDILTAWAKSTTARMQPGGDLYRQPKSREEMTAPLAWHELQLAVCVRFGVLADGSIGFARSRDGGMTWIEVVS